MRKRFDFDRERLRSSHAQAVSKLLKERHPSGHWEGELSSSALSTATAITALAMMERSRGTVEADDRHCQEAGIQWLAKNVNEDGGWGDTVLSLSNISTTALVWAAFAAVTEASKRHIPLMTEAEAWLSQRAGGVNKTALSNAIIQRYGKDKTFSIPILTMCALSGRFGKGREAWKTVQALPFELAAFPPRFYAALKLPVVSYALPALIAIGQVRHFFRPAGNPLLRAIRNLTRQITLQRLTQIQPSNGGFLEASPLTSFVVMSLAGCGLHDHPVARAGSRFLRQSMRPDGSWPIDTNLATWVTSLSVQGLGERGLQTLQHEDKDRLLTWLLNQQYQSLHPFTQAAPGGWAWTDLPGGVPDADDTPGALIAIHALSEDPKSNAAKAEMGIRWLIDLQNRDGGIPTFCRGWGRLPFDRSSADLTAHCIRAWQLWRDWMPASMQGEIDEASSRALQFMLKNQSSEGFWIPLWFGNQHVPGEHNPIYGTVKVIEGLLALKEEKYPNILAAMQKGLIWLLDQQNPDGGWGGALDTPSSNEESALSVLAITRALRSERLANPTLERRSIHALERGTDWLCRRIEDGNSTQACPIGFYFAKLWYFELGYPIAFIASTMHEVYLYAEEVDAQQTDT
jgi:squalene-hopene/tetraprenyl-beta-curcumene cyclase